MNYRAIVAPIVAVIFMAIQLVFGVDIGEEVQSQVVESIVNIITVGLIIYGIFVNPKKDS